MKAGFQNGIRVAIAMFSLFFVLLTAANAYAQKPLPDSSYPPALFQMQKKLTGFFYGIGLDLSHSVDDIARLDLRSQEARSIIADVFKKHQFIVNCAIVDRNGTLVTVEPPAAREAEGKSIAGQSHYEKLKATKKPVLSNIFKSVEGFEAIALQYPILSQSGEFLGSLSILIKPEEYFSCAITSQTQGFPLRTWLIQTDGAILFSPNAGEFGKNIFESKNYQYVLNLSFIAEKIKNAEIGRETLELSYDPSSGDTTETAGRPAMKKNIFWATVGLFDTKWRIMMTKASGDGDRPAISRDNAVATAGAALKSLAADDELKKALESGSRELIMEKLKIFYNQNPGLYSVEWVDQDAVCRFGFPAEKSLLNYDYKKMTTATSAFFIEAIRQKKATSFETHLIEGGLGYFIIEPVQNGSKFLGLVYCILP